VISIVMKPVHGAPSVKGEGLYDAVFRGGERLFRVRARNAPAAEEKVMIVFRHELKDKSIDFSAADFPEYRDPSNRKEEDDGMQTDGHLSGEVRPG
jgi:hypothetical protein